MEGSGDIDLQPHQGAAGRAGLDRVGISRQAVISIEKYKYTPSLELAFKIAEAFGVSIDRVFEHREEEEE